MLYISNLKSLIKSNRYSLKEMAELVGLTDSGFHLALKNNTLKVRDLEKISEILKIDVREFFSDDPTTQIGNVNAQVGDGNTITSGGKTKNINKDKSKVEILKLKLADLENQLKAKDELLKSKEEIIELLRNK